MPRARKYSPELIERGVRLVLESGRPIVHVAEDLGIQRETLRRAVRQAEADSGKRTDVLSSQEREEIRNEDWPDLRIAPITDTTKAVVSLAERLDEIAPAVRAPIPARMVAL